jgi:hypothetical protein
METRRLRSIQQPSRIERLLDGLISDRELLPKEAYQLRDPNSLPPPLQRVVTQASEQGRVWLCWANSYETWLFTAEMSLPLSRERGAPVLQVNRFDEKGDLNEAGSWISDPHGKWRRLSD